MSLRTAPNDEQMRAVSRLLGLSRYFVLVAVVGSFVAAAAAMVFGGVATAKIVIGSFSQGDYSTTGVKLLSVGLLR